MNPPNNTPPNPVDLINPEDDVELQAIEAIEAREVDLDPAPLRMRVAPRPVAPRPVVQTPAPAPAKPVIVATPAVIKQATPAPAPKAAAPPIPAKPVAAPVKKPVIIAPKPIPTTPSSQMAAELEKAPPLNTAQLILQFFGRHTASKQPVMIVSIAVAAIVVIAIICFVIWQALQF